MQIGVKITELREENKLSQDDLANILNISPQIVTSWELSELRPNLEEVVRLAKLFKVSCDYLLVSTVQKKVASDNKRKYDAILIHRIWFSIFALLLFICCLISILRPLDHVYGIFEFIWPSFNSRGLFAYIFNREMILYNIIFYGSLIGIIFTFIKLHKIQKGAKLG